MPERDEPIYVISIAALVCEIHPQTLREYAGLSKDCLILGLQKYIEIWSEAAYQSYLSENEAKFKEAAEELGGRITL